MKTLGIAAAATAPLGSATRGLDVMAQRGTCADEALRAAGGYAVSQTR